LITIEDNGMITIIVTKHLDSNTKCLKVLLCYDLTEGVIDKKEKILFVAKLDLFTIGTITLPKLEIFNAAIFSEKTNIEDLMFNFPHSKGQIQVDTTPSHKSNSMIWILFIRHYLKITK